jgi:hypothetical protein
MEIKTQIQINAKAEKVWRILTDFERYPRWNPFIKSIKGTAEVGKTISVRIEPPEAKGMTFTPKVLAFTPNKEFRWKGKLLLTGLFDGEHIFEIIDNGDETVTFLHREKFSGLLVPAFRKMLEVNTPNGFRAMNEKLKELAERQT